MYEPSAIAGLVVTAVLTAGLYALMSFGLALVYGVMKIINLAHAGTMMLSAFVVLELNHPDFTLTRSWARWSARRCSWASGCCCMRSPFGV